MDYQERLARLDEERRNALASGNSLRYYLLCNELGVEPEARDLYEMGEASAFFARKNQAEFERSVRNEVYLDFLNDAKKAGINLRELGEGAGTKARLLRRYFPRRFGDEGSQPLRDYPPEKIGKIFKRIFAYAEKVARDR